LWVRPEAHPKLEHLKGVSLREALALPVNIGLGWKRLAKNKHSSLLQKFINYVNKKFYSTGPWTYL
jgi:hypothetical protein